MSKGTLTATLAVFPYEMGRIAMQTARDHLAGKEVPKFVKTPTEIMDKDNRERFQ